MLRHILVVSGDDRPVTAELTKHEFLVRAAASGRDLKRFVHDKPADLIVLDTQLPHDDAFMLLRRFRSDSDTPIIMVSPRFEEIDCVVALEMGADDYLSKPLRPRELVARIRAALRRSPNRSATQQKMSSERYYRFGEWELDQQLRTLKDSQGRVTRLTRGEFQLLLAFIEGRQCVLSRERLMQVLHGQDCDVYDRSIDMQVLRLRRKVERDPHKPALIKTERSLGYVFTADVSAVAG